MLIVVLTVPVRFKNNYFNQANHVYVFLILNHEGFLNFDPSGNILNATLRVLSTGMQYLFEIQTIYLNQTLKQRLLVDVDNNTDQLPLVTIK